MIAKMVSSPRADSIVKMRDIVVLGVNHRVTDRERLVELAKAERLFVTRNAGTPYSHSSVYRYFASLLFLGFDMAESIEHPIEWSPAALDLADAARTTALTETLSEPEKKLFCNQMFNSPVLRRDFLAYFCPDNVAPESRREFAQGCKPLYVVRILKEERLGPRSSAQRSTTTVEVSLDPFARVATKRPAMEFLYTYRLWCLDAGLIEEINIKEARRHGVERERSHVLYPTDDTHPPSVGEFIEHLYRILGNVRQPTSLSIPRLFYSLCIDLRMTVAGFKQLLLEAHNQRPELIHFERSPGVLIQGELDPSERDYSGRFGNHRYYIILDGTVRSTLVLFPRR